MKPGIFVALTGYATSGKDAFADFLVEEFGYEKMSFADPLYDLCLSINPVIWRPWRGWQPLQKIIDEIGWNEAKKIDGVRRMLQKYGMKCRELFGEDVFVNVLIGRAKECLRKGKNVVAVSMRFANEARAVIEADGSVLKISRPGVGPVNEHISDSGQAFEFAMAEIYNDGGLDNLRNAAIATHKSLVAEKNKETDALVHPEIYVARMHQTVKRSFALGVKLVVSVAAPEDCTATEYAKRHRVEVAAEDGSTAIVFVDGEAAGEVEYDDGILFVECYIAR
jgi:hypothetical protein